MTSTFLWNRKKIENKSIFSRFSKAKTSSIDAAGDQESEEMVTVDIYQHPEKRNVKVEVKFLYILCLIANRLSVYSLLFFKKDSII